MKMHVPLVLAILGLAVVASALHASEAGKDTDRIQGTWAAISYVEDGKGEGQQIAAEESPLRWIFKKDKVTFLADVEGASPKGSFKLDPAKKVKTIDITFPSAPGKKKGQTMLGIYELEGDTLKICYDPDGVQRPTGLKSAAGSKHIMVVFKKVAK